MQPILLGPLIRCLFTTQLLSSTLKFISSPYKRDISSLSTIDFLLKTKVSQQHSKTIVFQNMISFLSEFDSLFFLLLSFQYTQDICEK